VALLTDTPKQRNPNHPAVLQSEKDHWDEDTGRPAKSMPGLAKVETSGSIYVLMPTVMKPIAITNDSQSNEGQEP